MTSENVYSTQIYINHWNTDIGTKQRTFNRISSTRYTWYSFIPVVIFQQFQIISNYYFLLMVIINGIIDSPVASGIDIFPLSLLIFLSVLARAYEEIKLYISDKELNEQSTLFLRNNTFVKCQFQSIRVGDIVKCENHEPFPADLLLLFSSRDTNDCSVTTVNLDGESNLKTFHGVIEMVNDLEIREHVKSKQMEIHCIDSCEDLHKYRGSLRLKENSEENNTILSEKNLLLRGARLKNTDFIIGCVVYAGHNTKLSLNSKIKKIKSSSIDNRMHIFIFLYFVLQTLLSFTSCLIANLMYFKLDWFNFNWYVPQIPVGLWKQFEIFLAFFVLYNKLLPVSLIFSIYTLKAFAAFFFNMDLRMYDEEIDQKARVNTIELIEELGQIEYLFSDKTGTLTENKMKFHCCSTGEDIYREIDNELYETTIGEPIKADIRTNKKLIDLFTCLCLCHTVKVSNEDGSPNVNFTGLIDTSVLVYQACSPDEEALLDALRRYNFSYLGAKRNTHYISICGDIRSYIIHEILEFDSTRKCMSTIVEFSDGSIQLICKGAESSLFPLAENRSMIATFMENLAEFSQDGLRVLVISKRMITKEELEIFTSKLNQYRSTPSLADRENEIYSLIENKLTLIGVTGVEDKLQEGVPETIRDLKEAGIKIWVITGDKEETAVNISLSAGHIDKEMFIHRITNMESQKECVEHLDEMCNSLRLSEVSSHALVVDGKSFAFLVEPLLVSKFVELFTYMKATLCCRMTPLQKSQIVKLVKENVKPTPITAAIGDGGNDVSMILEAHVGIGIFGKEGRQAARIADYAIGKFRFLKPALLIHGQNFYIRLTTYIRLFFYKSVMYVNPMFLYSFLNAFSEINIYDTVSAAMYNLTFSTAPIIVYAVFDKTLPDEFYLLHPILYRDVRRNRLMNVLDFFKSFFLAFLQSSIIFTILYFLYSFNNDVIGRRGKTHDYFYFGLLIFYCIWGVLLVKIALLSKHISKITVVMFFGNIVLGFVCQFIYQAVTSDRENSLTITTLSEPFSWLLVFIIILICSNIDIFLTLYGNYKAEVFERREQIL